MVLTLWAPAGIAYECKDRIMSLAKPLFPKSFEQLQILEKENFCVIDTAFSINQDGRAENIEYRTRKEACRPFNVNAIRAVRNSRFSTGPYLRVCYLTLTFWIQDGQPAWRYD